MLFENINQTPPYTSIRDENYVHVYFASPDMDTYNGYGPTQFQLLIHNITSGEETKAVSEKIQKTLHFFFCSKKKKSRLKKKKKKKLAIKNPNKQKREVNNSRSLL